MTVDLQILDALAVLLTPSSTGAQTVDIERDDAAEPYEAEELPAINLLAVEESIDTAPLLRSGPSVMQVRSLSLVVQVIYRGTASARRARALGATVERLVASDPTLGGLCVQGLVPDGRQWVRDDSAERPLTRQNTRFSCDYRTLSSDPSVAL